MNTNLFHRGDYLFENLKDVTKVSNFILLRVQQNTNSGLTFALNK